MNNPTSDFQMNKIRLQELEVEMQGRAKTFSMGWVTRGLVAAVALLGVGSVMFFLMV